MESPQGEGLTPEDLEPDTDPKGNAQILVEINNRLNIDTVIYLTHIINLRFYI